MSDYTGPMVAGADFTRKRWATVCPGPDIPSPSDSMERMAVVLDEWELYMEMGEGGDWDSVMRGIETYLNAATVWEMQEESAQQTAYELSGEDED